AKQLLGQQRRGCVPAVRQRDHAEARGRMPAHVRAEARVAAGVADDPTEADVVDLEQAEAVVQALDVGDGVGRGGREAKIGGYGRLLHLAAARAGQRVAALRLVAWWPCVLEAGDPAR